LGTTVQGMDYQYNERGWLTQINHQNLDALDNGVPQDPGGDGHNGITQGDKFAEVIGYNQQGHIGGGTGFNWQAQYNGNISWSITHTDGIELPGVNAGVPDPIIGYVYNYDGANRLTNADFGYYHSTSGWSNTLPNAAMYDLPNISYYGNGNINNLQRYGVDASLMDNFTYNYQPNTNKLNSIADAVTMQSYTYGYDDNGNLISDTFRGITNIVYNNRNLPEQLTSSGISVSYWYDGAGNRMRKQYEDDDEIYVLGAGGETEAVFDAEGNAKFFNITSGSENLGRYEPLLDELKLMNIILNKKYTGNKIIVGPNVTVTGTAELKAGTSITLKPGFTAVAGCSLYAHIDPAAATLTRFYYLKDHLGSTRVTVNQDGSDIVSYDDYDPWGMQLDGRSGNLASAFDKFKFTGKERDVETGYDYGVYPANGGGARYYDSRIARWLQVDPLAEKYPGWSTYNYGINNPMRYIDPDGKGIWEKIKAGIKIAYGVAGTALGAGVATKKPWLGTGIMVSSLTSTVTGLAELVVEVAPATNDKTIQKGLLVSTLEGLGMSPEKAKSVDLTISMVELVVAIKALNETGKVLDFLNTIVTGDEATKKTRELVDEIVKRQQEEQRQRGEEERRKREEEERKQRTE